MWFLKFRFANLDSEFVQALKDFTILEDGKDIVSVGDGPETPRGSSEQAGEDGRVHWEEEMGGYDVQRQQDDASTADCASLHLL